MIRFCETLALVALSVGLVSCGVYATNTPAGNRTGNVVGGNSAPAGDNSTGNGGFVLTGNGGATNGNSGTPPAGSNNGATQSEDDSLLMDFGGMWGSFLDHGVPAYRNNPITGAATCPQGYTQNRFTGALNEDYSTFYCWRPHVAGRHPDWDFGGAFGYTTGSIPYVNPVTGGTSCPSGYSMAQPHGSDDLDWSMFFCYRNHQAGQNSVAKFAGMIGTGTDDNTGAYLVYNNPLNNGTVCPNGYSSYRTLGADNVDHNVYQCIQF